jgi:hypothetical protein
MIIFKNSGFIASMAQSLHQKIMEKKTARNKNKQKTAFWWRI